MNLEELFVKTMTKLLDDNVDFTVDKGNIYYRTDQDYQKAQAVFGSIDPEDTIYLLTLKSAREEIEAYLSKTQAEASCEFVNSITEDEKYKVKCIPVKINI